MNESPNDPSVKPLTVPGAELYYEVGGDGPVVVLTGCPMDAAAFAPLAQCLAPHFTVITTDPRGIGRSKVDNPDRDVTPEILADDLSRIVATFGERPVVVFGSSGGAVTALAFAQAHPEQVTTVIAHEPPLEELLDDRHALRCATEEVVATYLSGDIAGAWAKFLASANITMPTDATPDNSTEWSGDRDPQQVADELFFFAHTLRPSTWWIPDIEVLLCGAPQIVVAIGEKSAGQTCDRTSRAFAARLGLEPVIFPGDHTGFVESPCSFAERLRPHLQSAST